MIWRNFHKVNFRMRILYFTFPPHPRLAVELGDHSWFRRGYLKQFWSGFREMLKRERYFEELFKLLRLSQMKPTYLTRHVKPERLVANNEVCVKLVACSGERHALRAENIQSGTFQHLLLMSHYLAMGKTWSVIMVIGGVSEGGDYLSECVGYFVGRDRWVNHPISIITLMDMPLQ